jgi:VWFA-related protein
MSRPVALVAAVVFSFVLVLRAQDPPQKPATSDPQRPPTFRTETNFVRVDVFPTLKGVPVRDLTAADFHVFEDGKPQKIETFEFVQVRGGIPQEARQEPNTVQQSRDALLNPRARVFVLFLDVHHVRIHGSWNVREPLIRLIDRVLGPEDLVGIMTPYMSPADIVFARKTQVIAGGLRDRWPWGERFTIIEDEKEIEWKACYPWPETDQVVQNMKARRRERMTLDAMRELVNWLRYEREERKAILTISEGWQLFTPNADLTRLRVIDPQTGATEPPPGPDPIGVGPDGRLRMGSVGGTHDWSKQACDRDRLALSLLDNDRYFRDIMDDANRGNASFYTVDPRGLAAFDAPIGPEPPPPIDVDLANLRHRLETLQTLAENTDGLAVINSNDLDKGFRRIADDLSSYYLLGYYTTNSRLDGRYRQIKVNVTRPGVDVRARRGYRAATREEVTAARTAASAPVPEAVSTARTALAALAGIRPGAALRTRAVASQGPKPMVWVAGELAKPAAAATTADITLMGGGAASATAAIAAGARGFVVGVPLAKAPTEPIDVRIRLAAAGPDPGTTDLLRIEAGAGLPHPVLFRRGPSTGNRLEPVGDPVYSRTERLRAEVAATPEMKVTDARILDRNGNAVELPVALGERTDASGQRWLTVDVTLAALGAGDYIIELSGVVGEASHKGLTALRVTR